MTTNNNNPHNQSPQKKGIKLVVKSLLQRKKMLLIILIAIGVLATGTGVWGVTHYLFFRGYYAKPNTVNFESEGGMASVEIDGPANWTILNTPKSWVSVMRNGNSLVCEVSENNSFGRGDTLIIGNSNKRCTFIIKQESGAFYATPSNAIIDAGGGSERFYISGQNNWHIESGPEGWGSAYRDNNCLVWNVNENFNGPRRDAIILKSGNKSLTITITQSGALNAEKMSVTIPRKGGTSRIAIYGPDDWSCDAREWWINCYREGDKLRIDCDENDENYEREGVVFVRGGGQTITIEVTQSKKASSSSNYYNNWYYNPWGW